MNNEQALSTDKATVGEACLRLGDGQTQHQMTIFEPILHNALNFSADVL